MKKIHLLFICISLFTLFKCPAENDFSSTYRNQGNQPITGTTFISQTCPVFKQGVRTGKPDINHKDKKYVFHYFIAVPEDRPANMFSDYGELFRNKVHGIVSHSLINRKIAVRYD
ncbi:MAG: hypothetical protein LUG18_08605 [Candidatus Azobacteroides sp.]|nr:hypothetical protein [Candidatus Azobacteroides sp.]